VDGNVVKYALARKFRGAYFQLESKRSIPALAFATLQVRLLTFVNNCVSNGECTERGLARMTGISQPHLHNVLKGARKLSPEIADTLLAHFEISVVTLLTPEEIATSPRKPMSSAHLFGSAADKVS
jgi:hypothetical protein